jgi:hypothetical protein
MRTNCFLNTLLGTEPVVSSVFSKLTAKKEPAKTSTIPSERVNTPTSPAPVRTTAVGTPTSTANMKETAKLPFTPPHRTDAAPEQTTTAGAPASAATTPAVKAIEAADNVAPAATPTTTTPAATSATVVQESGQTTRDKTVASPAGAASGPAAIDTTAFKRTETVSSPGTVQYTKADRASLAEFQRHTRQLLRDNAQLQYVMCRVQAHDRTLHMIVGKTVECPKVVWFYPKKPELRDWLSNPMTCLFQAPLMMVVVCPVTLCVVPCGPDGVGWEVAMPKKWVKEWGPAILFSIYVLQAAVVAGRVVGIPLPPMPDTKLVKEALGLKGMLGSAFSSGVNQANLSDSLSSFADTTQAALDLNPQLQSLCEGLKQPAAGADGGQALPADLPMHLVGEAYKSIHKFLLAFGPLEDQLRGRMERVMAPDGDVEWVSVEGKDAWLKKHELIVSPLQSKPTPPPRPERPGRNVPPLTTSVVIAGSIIMGSWLVPSLTKGGMLPAQIEVCERALIAQEGFTTEASFAALPPIEFNAEYLMGLGITAKGTQMQLISLHRELHAQYTGHASPTPSTSSGTAGVTLTAEEREAVLKMHSRVDSLTAELSKLRAASAGSSQQSQQSGGGGGGKGGLMLKQAQCNVVNPRTGQPYSMDELVTEIGRLEGLVSRNADDIAGVATATREGLENMSPSSGRATDVVAATTSAGEKAPRKKWFGFGSNAA